MLYINWRFTLIALSIAPALFAVVYSFTRRIKKASRALRKKESELVSVVEEVLTSARVVKAFAREDFEVTRFESQSLENVETALEARSIKAKLSPIVDVMVAIGTCLVLGYGAHLALRGQLSAGVLIVFLLYLGKMYKPMRELSKMTDTVSKAMVGYERIQEVLEIEARVRDLSRARRAPRFKGKIEFDRVNFAYDEKSPVLKDISFSIEPGYAAAIVGPSGTGKTTIISLIPRFYDPQSGTVKIDGTDIRSYTLKSVREQISSSCKKRCFSMPRLGQHRIWQAGCHPGTNHACRKTGERTRVYREIARGLRHHDRRARSDTLRWTAPTHLHRPSNHPRHAHPNSRRAYYRSRFRFRTSCHRSAGAPDGGQDVHRHCASSKCDPPRRHRICG